MPQSRIPRSVFAPSAIHGIRRQPHTPRTTVGGGAFRVAGNRKRLAYARRNSAIVNISKLSG